MLPQGILRQVGEQCYDLKELGLKQCSGNEMLDVESFAALCDGCRQLKTMDLVRANQAREPVGTAASMSRFLLTAAACFIRN